MSTLSELRTALRTMVSDNAAGGYLWSDAALNLHINDALRSYSSSFPRERRALVTTLAGETEYALPADCATVVRVTVLGPTPEVLGECDPSGYGYQLFGGKLILQEPAAAGATLEVQYLAPHAVLASDTDSSTSPATDDDLILALAAVLALQSMAVEEAKRQRFEQRSGQPAREAAALYWERYSAGVRARGSRIRSGRLVAS